MPSLANIVQLTEPWATAYANTPVLQTATTFAHFAGFLLGGGFAIATDSATLRAARRREPSRRRQLAYIHGIHRLVLIGLGVTLASGLLMFASDVETFATSTVFWVKMGLVMLLLANGGAMALTEKALRAGTAETGRGWSRMRGTAQCSLVLWFAAVLAGTMLVNPGA